MIKQKLEEIQNYFNEKVIKGDYEVVDKTEHNATILIDGEYKFRIWISSGYKYMDQFETSIFGYSGPRFISLPKENRKDAWDNMSKKLKKLK